MLDEYSINLIKIYENDLKEIATEKEKIRKRLFALEREKLQKIQWLNEIKEGGNNGADIY